MYVYTHTHASTHARTHISYLQRRSTQQFYAASADGSLPRPVHYAAFFTLPSLFWGVVFLVGDIYSFRLLMILCVHADEKCVTALCFWQLLCRRIDPPSFSA
jgi:hypothetical protein